MANFPVVQNKITEKAVRIVFISILIFITFLFLRYDLQIINAPFQLEYREGSILLTTDALLRGENPYNALNQPFHTNVYGVIYNVSVLPLVSLFGNTLWAHRSITGFSLFLSAALISFFLYKKGVDYLYSISAGILFLACQFFFVNPLARPDGLGLLFFLLSLLIPWRANYDRKSLLIGGLFSIFAFYTKPYFVLCLPYLCLYLFLFVSKKKALFFGSFFFLLYVVIFLIVWRIAPYYFYDVLFIHYHNAGRSWQYMSIQVGIFFTTYGTILLWVLVLKLKQRKIIPAEKTKSGFRLDQFLTRKPFRMEALNSPMLVPFLDLPDFCFILSFLLIVFSFGLHTGNYMVYLFQLMSPFLVMMLMQRLSKYTQFHILNYIAILINIILSIQLLYSRGLNFDYANYISGWDRAQQVISESKIVFNSPALVAELFTQRKPIVDTGQNEYFFISHVPELFFLPEKNQVKQIGDHFQEEINQSVKEKVYDHILVTPGFPFLFEEKHLKDNYRLQETIYLEMPISKEFWAVEVWLPK